jgi:hypothetical protein
VTILRCDSIIEKDDEFCNLIKHIKADLELEPIDSRLLENLS